MINSKGSAFFRQIRVGKHGKEFALIKFRSMYQGSHKGGLLTVGNNDSRITPIGYRLRKYKLDELPQLFNVLMGDMSLVGPRPEVRKFVDMYTDEQKRILTVKPGITDYASIKFRNENEMISSADNPQDFYVKVIMPQKIALNMVFINKPSIIAYFTIIIKTIFVSISGK
jgi:lipopolysaccharide/colanic/teichoic acid biosynthesis glycosyltransferase